MIEVGIVTLAVAGVVSALTTSALILVAPHIGAVDLPGPRKIHSKPIPRIGGLGVFAGFAAGILVGAILSGRSFANVGELTVLWSVLGLCALAMFAMGLVDDIRGLSFKTKFAVQILAAVAVWAGGFRIEVLTNPFGDGNLTVGSLSLPLTVLWIVGITNAINLIDGLDGLAAGTALIMTSAVACIAFVGNQTGVVAASVALVGALLGFLVFNFNPARIFLGDSGSMFLGFVLAVISVRGSQKGPTAVAVLAPLLILGLPILDTSFAVLRRLIRISREGPAGRARFAHVARNVHHLFLPDRGHLHHQLLDLGIGHRTSVLVLYVVVGTLAVAAFLSVVLNSVLVATLLVGALAILTATFVVLLGIRQRRSREPAPDLHPAASSGRTD